MLETEVNRVLAESGQALAELLKAELQIAVTFVETARTERNVGEPAASERALSQARKARDTIARFLGRLEKLHDPDRAEIQSSLEKLDRMLEEAPDALAGGSRPNGPRWPAPIVE